MRYVFYFYQKLFFGGFFFDNGNSIVNRAFYGVSQNLTTRSGQPTNAIVGFLNILNKLLEEEKPDALCVTFDRKAPTFRHLAYEGYKAQRKGMPEDLAVQMPILKEVLDAMGIMRIEKEGFEADDLLGTLSRVCEREGDECVIVTGNSLLQAFDRLEVMETTAHSVINSADLGPIVHITGKEIDDLKVAFNLAD